jgi:hypothetical protein
LADLSARPERDDDPLEVGETCVLKIHWGQLEAWDILRTKENRPYPKKVQIIFQGLSFGDGNGFFGSDGEPRTRLHKSSESRQLSPQNRSGPLPPIWDSKAQVAERNKPDRANVRGRVFRASFSVLV